MLGLGRLLVLHRPYLALEYFITLLLRLLQFIGYPMHRLEVSKIAIIDENFVIGSLDHYLSQHYCLMEKSKNDLWGSYIHSDSETILYCIKQLQHKFLVSTYKRGEKILVKNPNGSNNEWDYLTFYKFGNSILKNEAVCRMCNQECKCTERATNSNQNLQNQQSHLLVPGITSAAGRKKNLFNTR